MIRRTTLSVLLALTLGGVVLAEGPTGYYRQPALHDDTLLFVAEGDLWKVALAGGVATRLTSHPGDESGPAISPDGRTVAFTAEYEGPEELYTLPISGGLPTRRTYGSGGARASGWITAGEVLYSTQRYSTLPAWQLVRLDVSEDGVAGRLQRVPLAQAADGTYDDDGTLFFTRMHFQGSHTKRYKGGTAQNLWRFAEGDAEAAPLTADYAGTSKRPMVWEGRVYFASDRDGTMNLWSMNADGGDLRQHTRHEGWDVKSPYLHGGRIVYQLGADLRVYDIAADDDRGILITLDSDLDQTRENWVDEPMDYLTAVNISPNGDRAVLTARGRVFVAPLRRGRFVEATRDEGVRYRNARFMPDGKKLLVMSDESGEVELWTVPANGVGERTRFTEDGEVLRWEAVPSPDGKWIAHHDKNQRLWLYDVENDENRKIDESTIGSFGGLAWSPDSRWLAYAAAGENLFSRIRLYGLDSGETRTITSDRYDSHAPAWSPDGKWLYLLSDRRLVSIVGSPWGSYQPEPFLDKTTRIYHIALVPDLRSPFAAPDELHPGEDSENDNGNNDEKNGERGNGKKKEKKKSAGEDEKEPAVKVEIDLEGIEERLWPVPVEPGNYRALVANDKALFWISRPVPDRKSSLVGAEITNKGPKVETIVEDIRYYDLSADGKKLLVRKGKAIHIFDAKPAKADLKKASVPLEGWALSVVPREEWRQMFMEAWRLERDYFYDTGMHGVDWPAMRDKYLPLVDRVTTRAELSDLIAQMVSELSALHIFVRGGDLRSGEDAIAPASLGAILLRDVSAGGYRVEHVYRSDPDEPDRRSPLARPGVDVNDGDIIETINGTPTLSVPEIGALLRRQSGKQVLMRVRPAAGGEARDVIVEPITLGQAYDLRYHEWEHTRRLEVERLGDGEIGYVHLRAMGGGNFTEWAKGYYPVFTRKGLVVDVRNNRGGNIDSWILGRLLRKAWFGWSQRIGQSPTWNMQYAFRGHVVVLCNERTASDGEAFTEGIRRLGIGTIIGTRTWGGEIWLSSSNFLVDRGIATAAEFGVFGPEGEWLIEGHGVDPDIVVDNLPHATFNGKDAQLEAAIEFLKKKIQEEPIEPLTPPAHPDKQRKRWLREDLGVGPGEDDAES
jgi:tricorn protease